MKYSRFRAAKLFQRLYGRKTNRRYNCASSRTRGETRLASFETLESRRLLSANNDFAEVQGTVLVSDTAPIFQFSVENPAFTLASSSTILSFQVEPAPGSTLDPAAVIVRDNLDQEVTALRTNNNTSAGIGSAGVFNLGLGDYTVHVPGEDGTTGGFDLTVALVPSELVTETVSKKSGSESSPSTPSAATKSVLIVSVL
jgi:hypothetical protein